MDAVSLSRSDSASSTQSMQHGGMPELLIGLSYNGMTGRLSVEVIKGSNFRNMAMNRAPGMLEIFNFIVLNTRSINVKRIFNFAFSQKLRPNWSGLA